MGTKANPGKYDCYANAKEDEPLFVFRANDPLASYMVEIWCAIRCGDEKAAIGRVAAAISLMEGREMNQEKTAEAMKCAAAMRLWLENKNS